jgi:hypothetical protein
MNEKVNKVAKTLLISAGNVFTILFFLSAAIAAMVGRWDISVGSLVVVFIGVVILYATKQLPLSLKDLDDTKNHKQT